MTRHAGRSGTAVARGVLACREIGAHARRRCHSGPRLIARVLHSHQQLLSAVVQAIACGQADLRDILAAGLVERVCWVVPRDSLRLKNGGALQHRAAIRLDQLPTASTCSRHVEDVDASEAARPSGSASAFGIMPS